MPRASLEAYKDMARTAGAVWKEHGALSYVECTGDATPHGELTSFPRAVQAKEDGDLGLVLRDSAQLNRAKGGSQRPTSMGS